MVQIDRNHVIDGAADDMTHVGTVFHCGHDVELYEVVVTRAQVHAMRTTPVPLLPALPDGRKIAVLGVYYIKAAGGYTGGQTVRVRYTNSSNTIVGSLPSTQMRHALARDGWFGLGNQSGTPSAFAIPEGGLDLNTTAAYAGDGGDLTITIRYIEVV